MPLNPKELEALFEVLKIAKPSRLQRGIANVIGKSLVQSGLDDNTFLKRVLNRGKVGMVRYPVAGTIGAVGTGEWLADLGIETGKAGLRDLGVGFESRVGAMRESGFSSSLGQMRLRRLQETIGINSSRLMTLEPGLAQQIMAGRILPQGAVVIGGQPRVDLLAQVAEAMGSQGFQEQFGRQMGRQLEGLL